LIKAILIGTQNQQWWSNGMDDNDDLFDMWMLGSLIPSGGCLMCLVAMIGIPVMAITLIL
jgi:hypothetical protein